MVTKVQFTRSIAAVLTVIIAVGGVSACTPEPGGRPAPTPSSSSSVPPPVPTLQPSPTPLPSIPGIESIPINIPCERVLTPSELYEFNPNVSIDPSPAVSEGALRAAAYGGVSCSWVNLTSQERFAISLVHVADDSLPVLRSQLAASAPGAGLSGIDGYFRVVDGIGILDVISGPYWITIESAAFLSAADVEPLVILAVDNVR